MTWREVTTRAKAMIDRLGLTRVRLDGQTVLLTDYESDEALRFLKPDDQYSLAGHRLLNSAFAREMKKRGADVEFVMVRMVDYFDWLARYDLENNPANRAQFISWLTAGEPKPEPLVDRKK